MSTIPYNTYICPDTLKIQQSTKHSNLPNDIYDVRTNVNAFSAAHFSLAWLMDSELHARRRRSLPSQNSKQNRQGKKTKLFLLFFLHVSLARKSFFWRGKTNFPSLSQNSAVYFASFLAGCFHCPIYIGWGYYAKGLLHACKHAFIRLSVLVSLKLKFLN